MTNRVIDSLLEEYLEKTGKSLEVTGPISLDDIESVEKHLGFSFHLDIRSFFQNYGCIAIGGIYYNTPLLTLSEKSDGKETPSKSDIVRSTAYLRNELAVKLNKKEVCIQEDDDEWFTLFDNESGLVRFYDRIKGDFLVYQGVDMNTFDFPTYIEKEIQDSLKAELEWQEKHGK